MSTRCWSVRLTLVVAFLIGLALPVQAQVEMARLAGMTARSIGPAGMSGRVAAVDVVVDDPDIIYVGAATGGVWKSTSGGVSWEPIFDDQPVAAIGAIAIYQASPDIVWVGTGEANPRNSASVGNGVYRSLDGGRTWKHLGLDGSERISRILLHPSDPDVAWVAAMGQAWGENEERGVYKTTDGGETWDKVLYVDERTGAADLVIDPRNPNKLIASMWEYRRWPFFFKSGGPGSGAWMTHDGGDTWDLISDGDNWPEGELGRIGLDIAPSDSNVVYALVEAKKSVLLHSGDGGASWRAVNTDTNVSPRPFYYADLVVDSAWPNRVYRVAGNLDVSDDGGKSFRSLIGFFQVHGDYHAFWVHPHDPTYIIAGDDGGLAISRDRGETWRPIHNLPLAQYYHVAVDNDVPYNVYGGLQDNGSWRGPSAVWSGGFFNQGIRNQEWQMVFFGDGFDTRAMNDDSQSGYAMSQGGSLARYDLRSGQVWQIKPDAPDDEELRFNWNAGLALDPFDPNVVYYGSQFVHRSNDRGNSWSIISPDLTTDETEWQQQDKSGGLTLDVTAAENYTTIIAIAPSTIEPGVLWVGTDDGRLHVTRDGGDNWTSLENNVPGVPKNTWIPHIQPSRFDPASAFVVFDDHRRSNWTPYVYRTDDYGNTWTSLAADNLSGYALAIVQDPVDPELLFLGTEFGLWLSVDGGSHWNKWTHGLPTVSVMDLVIHPRDHDLVIGTHGRAIYIIDDIRPLREIGAGVLEEKLHLFEIPDAQQFGSFAVRGELVAGAAEFVGQNRPYGALITFSASDEGLETATGPPVASARVSPFGPPGGSPARGPQAEIEILDQAGETVRTFKAPVHAGLNRAVWNLRRDPFRNPPGGGGGFFGARGGPEVLPGTYSVKVSYKDHSAEGTVRVLVDPRTQITDAERRAKWDAILEMGALRELASDAVTRIVELRDDVQAVLKRARAAQKRGDKDKPAGREDEAEASDPSPLEAVIKAGGSLQEALDAAEARFRVLPGGKGIVADEGALSKVGDALGRLQSSKGAPTRSDEVYMQQARAAIEAAVGALNELSAAQVVEFRGLTRAAGIELLPETEPLSSA